MKTLWRTPVGDIIDLDVGDSLRFHLYVKINVKTSKVCVNKDLIRKHLKSIIKAYLESLIND